MTTSCSNNDKGKSNLIIEEQSQPLGVYYDTEERRICLTGDFQERNTREILWALYEMEKAEERTAPEEKKSIDFYIHSDGGELDAFFAIYDTIQAMTCPVNTIVVGKAYSAGASLLLTGTGIRSAYPNANIMLHEFHGWNFGRYSQMKNYHEYLDKLNARLMQIISKHTGQPVEKVQQDMKLDLWLSAQEALAYGIIDEIIGEEEDEAKDDGQE